MVNLLSKYKSCRAPRTTTITTTVSNILLDHYKTHRMRKQARLTVVAVTHKSFVPWSELTMELFRAILPTPPLQNSSPPRRTLHWFSGSCALDFQKVSHFILLNKVRYYLVVSVMDSNRHIFSQGGLHSIERYLCSDIIRGGQRSMDRYMGCNY